MKESLEIAAMLAHFVSLHCMRVRGIEPFHPPSEVAGCSTASYNICTAVYVAKYRFKE
jgi:hypothetical protein